MTDQTAQPEPPAPARRPAGPFRFGPVVAVATVVVLLAGVYGIVRLRSNPAGAAACKLAVTIADRIAPLAHGEVAAFAVTHTPYRLPDLAFKDAAGREWTLKDWRGRTVLLNLWATWCVPCRREMLALDALEAKLGGPNFEVVAVNIDTRDARKPLGFLKDIGIKHLAYYSDQGARVFQDLKAVGKAFGMPTTLLVDRAGCEIGEMAGPAQWASDDAVKLVRAAVSSPD